MFALSTGSHYPSHVSQSAGVATRWRVEVFLRTGPAPIAWMLPVPFHAPLANPVGPCGVILIVCHLLVPRLLFHWTLIFFPSVPLLDCLS